MMICSELNTKLLVDESQLGDRLNRSLQDNHRADFSLMLAMLSKDVTDLKRAEEMSALFLKGNLRDVFLAQCIKQEPLLSAERMLDPEIEANLSPLEQTKLKMNSEGLSCEMIEKSHHDLSVLDEINASRSLL